jgi:hypothetical protein
VAQTFQLIQTGVIQAQPAQSTVGGQSLQEVGSLDIVTSYTKRIAGVPSIVGASDAVPYVLPFDTMTACRYVWLHVLSGAAKVKITTATETDQIIRVGSTLILHAPNPGEELTAIKVVGTCDLEYFLAGT